MRKIHSRKTEDKSAIKLAQKEIARSVNELESTKQKLEEDNFNLLEELNRKEEQHSLIIDKTKEFNTLKNKAEKDYIKSKNKLDDLNAIITWIENKNKDKLKESDKIEKEFKDKKDKLEDDFNAQEKSLLGKIDTLNNKIEGLLIDKSDLTEDYTNLTDSIDKLSKTEDEK